MTFFKTASARRPEVRRADRSRRHLGLESLEARQVLSASPLTVTTLADSGPGSLRAAILAADRDNGANTINFSSALNNSTIYPLTALPQLNDQGGLTINGASQVTIDLSGSSRIDSGDGGLANGTGNGLVVAVHSTATVENLTLVNSSARGVEVDGTATLLNATVSGSRNGGVVNFGTMTIKDSYVHNNTAWHYGGGVDNSHGTLSVVGSDIDQNYAPEGAGIDAYGGTVSITSDGSRLSYLEQNGASATGGDGGAIYMSSGSKVSMTGGWIAGNMAADGGGIHNDGGVLTATGVSFYGNSAMFGGAIDDYSTSASPTTLTNCDIEYNTASIAGGGIYVDGATIQLSASTKVFNNSAPLGSDIFGSYVRKN